MRERMEKTTTTKRLRLQFQVFLDIRLEDPLDHRFEVVRDVLKQDLLGVLRDRTAVLRRGYAFVHPIDEVKDEAKDTVFAKAVLYNPKDECPICNAIMPSSPIVCDDHVIELNPQDSQAM